MDDATFTITNTSANRDLVLSTYGPHAPMPVPTVGAVHPDEARDSRTQTQVLRPGESTTMSIKPHEHSWPIVFAAGRERHDG